MSVTITTTAALVAALANSGAGDNAVSDAERVTGSNSVLEFSGAWFVVALKANGDFQVYRSLDTGATWAAYGAAFTPTASGGGLSTHSVGAVIWIGYTQSTHTGNSPVFFANSFDTATGLWSGEIGHDCSAGITYASGPYACYVRPDGTFLWLISEHLLSTSTFGLVFDGSTFTLLGPIGVFYPGPGSWHGAYSNSLMRTDGTVDVFWYDPTGSTFHHQAITALDAVTADVQITYTGQILNWNGVGLGYGFLSSGSYYLSCGLKTADYPTIWGRPAVLFGTDGAWTMGALLDTGFDPDYSLYHCSLQLLNGMLVYTYRAVSSDGGHYVERVGYAAEGSHNTPAAWTWATAYDFDASSPAASGQATPYDPEPLPQNGAITGLSSVADGIRAVMTLKNSSGDLFVTYLFQVLVSGAVRLLRNTFE